MASRATSRTSVREIHPAPFVENPARIISIADEALCRTDTIVISDVHVGSEVCRATQLRRALKEWMPFRRLVILGDFFDDLNFSRLRKEHFGLMDDIRRLSTRHRIQVDWIEGNHDSAAHEVVRRIIGANVHNELVLDLHGKRYLFIHGHQFDEFLTDHPIITVVASKVYGSVQRREGGRKKSLSRWLKKKSKKLLNVSEKVERRAISYARRKSVDYIVCGHTHYHGETPPHGGPIKYVNSGCWTDAPSTLITIDAGGLKKHKYR
ncbi:UDP-2,3-diacylglucosamine diphosphatase [Candidatus Sumerlaeota bacterium]|nr:UDP-2,3-diacylglucosamine diphosphatase [Candidatus Sumerlaeota bacterium]